jgi:subtilisin-like proprotein convertase family protein
MRLALKCAAVAAAFVWGPAVFAGPEWVEFGDAGSLPGSEQETSGKDLGRIRGRLEGEPTTGSAGAGDFEDLYLIRIVDVNAFCATTVPFEGGSAEFTTALYLFTPDGFGLVGNLFAPSIGDGKTGEGGNSTITAFPTDGGQANIVEGEQYILAISIIGNEPAANMDPIFDFTSTFEVSSADGPGAGNPIDAWQPVPAARTGGLVPGDYVIALCGVEAAVALGACCMSDGSCELITEDECVMVGGDYQDDDTECFTPVGSASTYASAPNAEFDPIVTDDIVVTDSFVVGDLDVSVEISSAFIGDVEISLEHVETGTLVPLWRRACFGEDDIDATFDDEGNPVVCDDPVIGNITPFSAGGSALGLFDGESVAGTWRLRVEDIFGGSGTLVAWSLQAREGEPFCPQFIEVPVDIKPGGCPNSFNRGSHGVLPVGVLGTADFDVTDVDISTLRIARADGMGGLVAPNEGPPGPHTVVTDVGTPYGGDPCGCHDLDGDGIQDLSMKFRTDDVVSGLNMDEFMPGALVELVVSGELNDGTPFQGADCVRLVPPGSPPGQLCLAVSVPGAWTDVAPLDLGLDGGGFGSFERTYPQLSVVMLTAERESYGRTFVGWRIGGGPLVRELSIPMVIAGEMQSVEAVYEDVPLGDPVPIAPDGDDRGRPLRSSGSGGLRR